MTQQTCAPVRTFAEEGGHPIVACGSSMTGCICAVVDVLAAVVPRPAVHAHTVIPTLRVQARATVLAGVGHQIALVDIFGTELTCPLWFALAIVGVHSIHTGPSIKAAMIWTIIDVFFAVLPTKTWQTGALITGLPLLYAGAPV